MATPPFTIPAKFHPKNTDTPEVSDCKVAIKILTQLCNSLQKLVDTDKELIDLHVKVNEEYRNQIDFIIKSL